MSRQLNTGEPVRHPTFVPLSHPSGSHRKYSHLFGQSLLHLFGKYCDKPQVQPHVFARVITVLEATPSQPVRVHDDLSDESVLQIREIAVNTLVQVIGADGSMAALDALSTEEQG